MASPNLAMTSSPTANPDLPSHPSICSLSSLLADLQHSDPSKNLTSMSMDDLLKTIYSDSQDQALNQLHQDASISRQLSFSLPKDMGEKTVDEVWKEIVAGSGQRRGAAGDEMTLEDFLTKAGAVREEDVRVPLVAAPAGYAVDTAITDQFHMPSQGLEAPVLAYGNGIEGRVVGAGRGKRRAVEEPVDRATQQKQKRMIKNRESAARSRERKQAYTVELESLVTQLEEENSRLLREEAQQIKERCKQLKDNLIPVAEKRKPPRVLRRVQSMQW